MDRFSSKWRSLSTGGKVLVALLMVVLVGNTIEAIVNSQRQPEVASTTSTTTTMSLMQAEMTLPMFISFELLAATPGGEVEATCRERFSGDLVACYHAYERGTPDFEKRLAEATNSSFSSQTLQATPPCGGAAVGECIDGYGSYCDETEVIVDEYAHDLRCSP